jgi:hypothetical protein
MECERSDPDDPLRQGDIVAAHPQTDGWANPWTRFGVVLSADCDLAQEKTGPNLVYVPVVSHYTYLADVWLPSEAARLERLGREAIDKQLTSFDAKVQYRHIAAWGEKGGRENISNRLAERTQELGSTISCEKQEAILSLWHSVTELACLSAVPNPTQTDQLRDVLDRFIRYRGVVEPGRGDPAQYHKNMIERALLSLQDRLDSWLLRELIGLDPDMTQGTQFGFVVLLRSFSLLPVTLIETHREEWYRNKTKYLRICRLRGIYKADLVQRFANMFVRIGLEDYRDQEHKRLFIRCAESLFPGETNVQSRRN